MVVGGVIPLKDYDILDATTEVLDLTEATTDD